MSKIHRKSFCASIVAMLLITAVMVPIVSEVAQAEINSTGTYFWVSPSANIFKSQSSKFNVTIMIEDAPETYAWEATLKFNNNTLGVMRIFEGPWLSTIGNTAFFSTSLVVANKTGTLSFGCTLVGDVGAGATGDGELCKIEFHVETCGTSPLDLQDTALLDMNLVRTDYPNNDGFFACAAVHDIEISSVTASASQVNQGTSVTVTVIVYNGGNYTESGSVKVTARPRDDREPVEQIDIVKSFTNLAKGGSTPLTFTWDTTNVAGEVYDIVANATITGSDDDPHDNVYIGPVVRVVCPHDIDVVDVKLLTPKVHVGYTASVNVTVMNEGANTESFNVTVYFGTTGVTVSVLNLAADASKTVTASWQPNTPGQYSISAVVSGVTGEKDTLDNPKADGTLIVIYDDVAVIGATLGPKLYNITITIKNNGTDMARFMVYVWADPTPENPFNKDELLIGLVVGGALPSGANYTFIGLVPYGGIPYGGIATLYPPYTPLTPCATYGIFIVLQKLYDNDDNPNNNIFYAGTTKARLPGDINGDGSVTWKDLGSLGTAYGAGPTSPNWNPQADINVDGSVTWMDLGKVGTNYGKSC
ncbi:MAG: CARDB domain-containing protein [Candidatus Bathyarchaeaceae archaeon]